MKTTLITILAVFLTTSAFAQEIRISVSPTMNNAFYFKPVDGAPAYYWRSGFNACLGYHFKTDKRINLAVGLTYQNATINVDPFIPPLDDIPSYNESISLLSFSVGACYNFNSGFYATIDPLIHYQFDYQDNSTINQTGIGVSGGIGKKLSLKSNLLMNVEPKIWIHNLIPLQQENLPLRLMVAGINIGLIFK